MTSQTQAVPIPTAAPTASSPRWLTVVMRCDRWGSYWFVAAGFFFAPILLILHPWSFAVAIAWTLISLSGLWLGILGIFMAIGLAKVLRAGEEIPEEYWWSLLGQALPASR
ncbi:hypothetical protein [Gordonia insulae]|uniref:Uncharacterized protein n=1 Tax=Gordonia insulae TaxID=2420509 RepID=A0A3G8JQP1_9ACTN|nr:hypothetical protein [Gordonia insulae]AZG46490.1 hypothetical protein D7316_03091 [Gordonia insulae]